jgi:hypothetical protein
MFKITLNKLMFEGPETGSTPIRKSRSCMYSILFFEEKFLLEKILRVILTKKTGYVLIVVS